MRRQARLLGAIAGAVVFCLLLYVFVIGPRRSELSDVRAQVEDARVQQLQLRQQLAVLRDLQDRAPDLQADLEEIRGFVPKTNEVPNFIFQVQEAANRSGVGVLQVTPELPKQPPEGASLAEVRITIRADGGYFSLQDFVRRLYDLDRALRIDTMTVGEPTGATGTTGTTTSTPTTTTSTTSETPSGEIELLITARIFFELPPGGATGGTTTTTPTTTPTPVETPAPTDTTTPAVDASEAGDSIDQIRESPAPNPTVANPTP